MFKAGSGANAIVQESAEQVASPNSGIPPSISNPPDVESEARTQKEKKNRFWHDIIPRLGKDRHRVIPKASETSETLGQSSLEPLVPDSDSRPPPPILRTPAIHKEIERRQSEVATIQSTTPFHRRLAWALSDKEELNRLTEGLRRCNNDIESLLLSTSMKESALLLRDKSSTETSSDSVDQVKKALWNVHEALAKLNTPTDTIREGNRQKECQFSVQLREDSEINRKQLLQEPNVRLRDDSYIFNIQRQEDKDPKSIADLLFVETPKSPQDQLRAIFDIPEHLSPTELHNLALPPASGDGVEELGFFRTPSTRDIHVLFRDKSKRLHSPLHLKDIVNSADYRDRMNPIQIVQLVRLVLKSYLFFSIVRDSLDTHARLIHYRYFCRVGEEATDWDVERPLILRPWLSFGFGSRRRYNLGEDQGVQQISSPPLIELGLVLYQICVGKVMDYGTGLTVTDAKSTALKSLNEIDKAVGPTLTEIVHGLLSPTSLVAAKAKVGEAKETEYILNAIATLITYEEKVEDTVTNKEKESTPSPLGSNPEGPAASKGFIAQAVAGAPYEE